MQYVLYRPLFKLEHEARARLDYMEHLRYQFSTHVGKHLGVLRLIDVISGYYFTYPYLTTGKALLKIYPLKSLSLLPGEHKLMTATSDGKIILYVAKDRRYCGC